MTSSLLILASILLGTALPVLPVQLLWINMSTALLLGLMLARIFHTLSATTCCEPVWLRWPRSPRRTVCTHTARLGTASAAWPDRLSRRLATKVYEISGLVFEPKEEGIMSRPPREPAQPILPLNLILRIEIVSLFMVAGGFALFLWEKTEGRGLAEARTVVVNVIVMVELFYLLNCRSLTRPFFSLGVFSNLWVVGGVAAMIGAQLLLTYAPFMNKLFHSAPISGLSWLKIIAVGLVVFFAVELKKWLDARWQRAPACSTTKTVTRYSSKHVNRIKNILVGVDFSDGARRAGTSVDRHRPAGKFRVGSRGHRPPLRRRRSRASLPGDSAGHRRRADAPRSRLS